jgi:HK97 family phage portal protein
MSILARLLNTPNSDGVERRALTSSAFVPPPQVGVIDDFVGVHRAMANMTVYGCVRLLADTIASLPWKAYRRDKNGVPVALDPQPALIKQPMPGFDLFQWKWMVIANLALRGNSYHLITSRDGAGWPTAMLPLHPDIVFLERRTDILTWFDPIYRVMGEQVNKNDICHIRRFTMPGEPWGLSPIRQAAVAIGLSLASEEYGYRYFRESANPTGMLMTDQNLDPDAVERQQQNWIASHGGRRLPAVLTGGFKWAPLSIKPEESQFLATREFQRTDICIMFGVPPVLIGDTKATTAWGTGIQQLTQGAVTYTFRPWTACIEQTISDLLPRGQYISFDFDALLKGDIDTRFKAYQVAINTGWLSRNEARGKEEMEPKSELEDFLVPVNMAPAGHDPTLTAALSVHGTPGEKPATNEPSQPPRNGQPVGSIT